MAPPAPRRHPPRRRDEDDLPAAHDDPSSAPPPLRLKCIVLGSAGAGKTSLLRRFVHGSFEGRGTTPEKERSTTSTLGADYYVKRMECDPGWFEGGGGRWEGEEKDDDDHDERGEGTKEEEAAVHHHVTVQLWDTAGRERLKPKRHPAQYDAQSNFYQFLSIRPSKRRSNSSHYEHRYNNWGFLNGIGDEEHPAERRAKEGGGGCNNDARGRTHDNGRHRRCNTQRKHGHPLHYHRHNAKPSSGRSNRPLGDALFRHIDACMLVYDATSSMSFLHLMEWHAEVTKKLDRWEKEGADGEAGGRRKKRIPFMVVANKLDLLEGRGDGSASAPSSLDGGRERRAVLGFQDGDYAGSELEYEYTADAGHARDDRSPRGNGASRRMQPPKTGRRPPPAHPRLTYSLRETLWSTDASYVAALQRTEDALPANRRLILSWCARNGIPHAETSALDGRGVGEAMARLVRMGVEAQRRRRAVEGREEEGVDGGSGGEMEGAEAEEPGAVSSVEAEEDRSNTRDGAVLANRNPGQNRTQESPSADAGAVDPSQYYFLYQPRQDDKLDLFARYSAEEEERCSPFRCWLALFAQCRR